jgi:methylisocitrate lyase
MLHAASTAAERRAALRARLAEDRLLVLPGVFNPLSAMAVERAGFEAAYLSGAVMAAELGLPDVGLTTLSEVAQRTAQVTRVTRLPLLVDADTGFGEPLNVARTVQFLEEAGAAALHLEDQVNPKRCGHLEGKSVVDEVSATRRIAAAVAARRDANLLVVARTDARAVEGLESAIERARRYVAAGADAVFAEALEDEREVEAFRRALEVPLLINATEFGKGPLWEGARLAALGVDMVIFPVSLFRLAMGAAARGLATLAAEGGFASRVGEMQTRAELYELLRYDEYAAFDEGVAVTLPE